MSAGVLRTLAPLQLTGVPWLNGATKPISVSSLQSKVLCARHSSALSPLDSIAEPFIRAIRHDEKALSRLDGVEFEREDDEDTTTVIPGRDWELWMLKLLLGGMASRAFGENNQTIDTWADSVDVARLIEVLFYGAALPEGAGMSIRRYEPDPAGTPDSVGVTPLSSKEQTGLVGVAVELGIVEIAFSAVPTSRVLQRRVGHIRLERQNPHVQKVVAFAWSTPVTEAISLTKAERNSAS